MNARDNEMPADYFLSREFKKILIKQLNGRHREKYTFKGTNRRLHTAGKSMSYYYSSGSSYYDSYDDMSHDDTFTGFMVLTFGTFICIFLIVIMIIVCCICWRVKKHQKRVLVQPMHQLHYGTVAYATNHDQVQYIPSPNVQRVQRQQTLLTG